jgi:hypothetical protein
MDDDPAERDGEDGRESWSRGSSWKIQGVNRGKANGTDNEDGEAGEHTGLLDGQKREERRERIAKIALNGALSNP